MKGFFLIIVIMFSLTGCAVSTSSSNKIPITFAGEGSYQQLQEDRFECLKVASNREEKISGDTDSIEGVSEMTCSRDMFRACLAAKGWKRVYDGSGVGVATVVRCR